jgi:radical SAM protein with 4Fe4S-binding SPASM domain
MHNNDTIIVSDDKHIIDADSADALQFAGRRCHYRTCCQGDCRRQQKRRRKYVE